MEWHFLTDALLSLVSSYLVWRTHRKAKTPVTYRQFANLSPEARAEVTEALIKVGRARLRERLQQIEQRRQARAQAQGS